MENLPQNQNQSSEQYQMPPLEPTPTGLNQPSHSSKKLLVSIIILVAVIGGYSVFAKYQSWWPFGDVAVSTPTSTLNETSDWKTYRNEEYGLEVKYPPNTKIEESGQYSIKSILMIDDSKKVDSGYEFSFLSPRVFEIDVHPTNLVEDQYNTALSYMVVPGSISNIRIDNEEAVILKRNWNDLYSEVILIKHDSRLYTLLYLEDDIKLNNHGNYDIAKKILSTFKFIEPTSKIDTPKNTLQQSQQRDCGTIGIVQETSQQKVSASCIAQSTLNCSPAFVVQTNSKGVVDNKLVVSGKEGNYCVLSQETYGPTFQTLQTCRFPLSLIPTVLQVSRDSLSFAPGETIESLSFTQIVATAFLSHKYVNPYTNETTEISCSSQ